MAYTQTFTITAIDVTALTALDLRAEAEAWDESVPKRLSKNGIDSNAPSAYRITIYDDQGQPLQHEAVEALFCPTIGRLGIASGADATWADVETIESGIEMWLHDPDEWEARN